MPPLVALLAVLLTTAVSAQSAPTFQEIEESLTCQCGCGLTVQACNHLQCPSAIPLRQEIREQLSHGLGKDAILAHFERKYGEKILSSPTTRGFNLTAWTMPFVILAIGGCLVVVTLVRWRRAGDRRVAVAAAAPAPGAPGDDPDRAAHEKVLERELKRFES